MLDIIVPTYKRHYAIDRLINDLKLQRDQNFNLNIIDQSAQKYINKYNTNFKVNIFWVPTIRSPILARDYGVKITKSEILLFLDDDMIPSSNLVENIRSIYSDYKDPLVIGGISNVRIQSRPERLIRKILQRGIYDDPRYIYFKKSYEGNYDQIESFLPTPYISASILSMNRRVLEINPFPTHFKKHILGGDIYFGMECKKKKIRVCLSYLLRAEELSDENFEFKSIKGYKKIFLSFHSAYLMLILNGVNLKNLFNYCLRVSLICLFLLRILIKRII